MVASNKVFIQRNFVNDRHGSAQPRRSSANSKHCCLTQGRGRSQRQSRVQSDQGVHTARHRDNFELGILDFEFLQLSAFQFQLFLPVVPVAASVETKLGRGGTGEE
jgi:hypothetical protein